MRWADLGGGIYKSEKKNVVIVGDRVESTIYVTEGDGIQLFTSYILDTEVMTTNSLKIDLRLPFLTVDSAKRKASSAASEVVEAAVLLLRK